MESAMIQSKEVIQELYEAFIAQGLSPQEATEKSFEKADEENRVWYVGVTRTSQNLYIMASKKEAKGYDIESLQ